MNFIMFFGFLFTRIFEIACVDAQDLFFRRTCLKLKVRIVHCILALNRCFQVKLEKKKKHASFLLQMILFYVMLNY